jgi:hypothetical protein
MPGPSTLSLLTTLTAAYFFHFKKTEDDFKGEGDLITSP